MSLYTRADATTLKNHNGDHVQVVGVVGENVDPKTVKIDANGVISAHIPTSLVDDLQKGEAYAFMATVKDDESIHVNHAIHIHEKDYEPEVVARVVATQDKYADFFKPTDPEYST